MRSSKEKYCLSLSERGVAMLECCIIMPLLALMVVATYDLGGALNEYLMLTRASYEGARYAAVIPGFESAASGSNVPASFSTGSDFLNGKNHKLVHDRIELILDTSRIKREGGNVVITTENLNNETVRVTIRKEYKGHFGLFPDLTLKVSATGPFLSKPPI